jgi:hypothetical protein
MEQATTIRRVTCRGQQAGRALAAAGDSAAAIPRH